MPAAAVSCDFFSSLGCLFAATIRNSGDETQTRTTSNSPLDLSSLRISQLQVTPNGAYFIADCNRSNHLQLLSHQSLFGVAADDADHRRIDCGLDNSEIDLVIISFRLFVCFFLLPKKQACL
ncbi:MAG: hypothetical protein MHMPM18_003540 [Marteilia pararefringens]